MIRKSIYLILLIGNLGFGQSKSFDIVSELNKFVERGGGVEETSSNIYKLTYSEGIQKVLNFNPAPNSNLHSKDFETIIINVWEIDTTLYADKFKFWQKVNLAGGRYDTVPIEDINLNGMIELYGRTRYTWPYGGQVDILEQTINGTFHTVHTYDSTSLFVQGVGDVNSDGIREVHLRTTDTLNGRFYKADTLGDLPTSLDFIFYYYPNQINDESFGDFDKNGITDCAFVDGSNPSRIIISEFVDSINNFTTLFNMPTEGDVPSGFAVSDYDQDNKTELVLGTLQKKVYIIEAVDKNQYATVWQGLAPSYNAYMVTSTDDIDGNGKDEFWIGGMDLTTGISTFWCYEADGNNSYKPVAGIELRYLVTLYTHFLQSTDMDNDGVEELIINIGNHLLILKFTGEPNQHNYSIFYAKIGEITQPGAEFLPSTICDLNYDGKKDIFLSMDIYPPPDFSYILVQDTVASVTNNGLQKPGKFNLSQNYPNPFNFETNISYALPFRSHVSLKVFDILGNEIKTLINEEKQFGVYEVKINASNLSSGIYFYQLQAGDYTTTKKLILLK